VREWKDWKGTIADGDPWDNIGTLMPSMCYECEGVKQMVDQKAKDVIGPAIVAGVERLKAAGKEDLFGGLIMGWEAGSAGTYYYHSLSLKGISSKNSTEEINKAQQQILHDYLERWAKDLADAGVPKDRIYNHITGVSQWHSDNDQDSVYSEAFNAYSRAGFSIYMNSAAHEFDPVWNQANKQHAPWAEAEGTNTTILGQPSLINWETYLGRIFNHGGVVANIFAGFMPHKFAGYTASTESPEAIAAYKKFLEGQTLVESGPKGCDAIAATTLPSKIQKAQCEAQAWAPKHPSRAPEIMKLFDES
jgi:hypothetical protein